MRRVTIVWILSISKFLRLLEIVHWHAFVLLGRVLHERAVVNLVKLLPQLMNLARILFLIKFQIKELSLDLINSRAQIKISLNIKVFNLGLDSRIFHLVHIRTKES